MSKILFIFDLDGTLLNSGENLEFEVDKALLDFGIKLNEDEKKKLFSGVVESMGGKAGRLYHLRLIYRAGRFISLNPLNSVLFILNLWRIVERARKESMAFEEVVSIFNFLKEHKCRIAIVSDESRNRIRYVLKKNPVLGQAEVIVAREDVKEVKPSPEGIILACNSINVPFRKCVYIGDLPIDVVAGRKAGVATIAVLGFLGKFTKESIIDAKPDIVLDHIRDFTKNLLVQNLVSASKSNSS